MDEFIEFIKRAFQWLKNVVRNVINGFVRLATHVVAYFRNLPLNPNVHTPFLSKDKELIKSALKTAPRKSVGLFKGVYNEQKDEIEYAECIEADGLDAQTRGLFTGGEELVVLT